MHFVDHVDLEAAHHRLVDGLIEQLRDLFDAAVGGGIELHIVDKSAGVDIAAGLAHAAGVGGDAALPIGPGAIETLGQDARDRGLAHAARAGEQVGVVQAALRERIRQGLNHVLLAHQLFKTVGAVLAGEDLVAHPVILSSLTSAAANAGLR